MVAVVQGLFRIGTLLMFSCVLLASVASNAAIAASLICTKLWHFCFMFGLYWHIPYFVAIEGFKILILHSAC